MYKRRVVSSLAVLAAIMVLPAMAEPWPEAHSGSYLGVQITAVTPERASALKLQEQTGAIIVYVDQDGPACHAGLQENDVVVAFDGSRVDSPEQLQGMIHVTPPQKTVTLTVVRNGQRKDVKVTLGSWNVMSHARAFSAMNLGAPPPPHAFPDIEIPSFTVLSARHGLVVESLSPQLADFFGVSRGQGVLVRSVEGGSPAAVAGLKAGDVILKVNNEAVHDMSDWQRGMHAPGNKFSLLIWRDKREQNFVINVPTPGDNSRLGSGDWLNFDSETLAQLGPSEKELEQLRQDIDKMSREIANAAPTKEQMEQLRQQVQRSVPSQQELEEMKRQIQQSMPSQKDFDEMRQQIQASVPSQKELEEMRRQIDSSMKSWTPQFQQQMEQLKKQMELDLQQMMQELQKDKD